MWLVEKFKLALELTWEMLVILYGNISDSLEIFWKGMLAIFLALGVICVVTIILNKVINTIDEKRKNNTVDK